MSYKDLVHIYSRFFFTTKINSCQCLVTNNINSFQFNDSFIKLRVSCHRAFTVQVTVIEKINSGINIFIIYNFQLVAPALPVGDSEQRCTHAAQGATDVLWGT